MLASSPRDNLHAVSHLAWRRGSLPGLGELRGEVLLSAAKRSADAGQRQGLWEGRTSDQPSRGGDTRERAGVQAHRLKVGRAGLKVEGVVTMKVRLRE